jgi:hypothetical protein
LLSLALKPMPKLRYQSPERLLGATDFSKHERLCGAVSVVRLLRSVPWTADELRKACTLEVNHGRKREPGQWELAAVAFVVSGHVDLQPWWANTTDELWRECGFTGRPPYGRVWARMRELGTVADAFLEAAGRVIKRCRNHDPRVFAHVHVDFTEDETHAALVHDCQDGEDCKRLADQPPDSWKRDAALRPARVVTRDAREQREQWNEQAPEDSVRGAEDAEPDTEQKMGKGRRVRIGGCWYRTRDAEAGTRAYTRHGKLTRFWHGYYSGKAVDHLTGGAIPCVEAANRQEYHLFPDLFDRVCDMTGATPQTVIGDRGFAVKSCYKYLTTRGCGPIFPWRASRKGQERKDFLTHDRHGVKRCKHCGGEMKQNPLRP